MSAIIDDLKRRMHAAIEVLKKEFGGLRTGRASASLLDNVMVSAYGSPMPINQVSTISVPEARLITIQVWDKGMLREVEKAILESGLGLNPQVDGTLIRLPLPDLSEERRRELVKLAAKYAEAAKISVRNVRRDGMDTTKKQEKDKQISEDDSHRLSDEIQKLTDTHIQDIDDLFSQKEKDIMRL
jgi:ribosome recycling factor